LAIDTPEKRLSIGSLALTISPALVTPNASPDQEWRQEVGWLYSGITIAAPDETTPVDDDADVTVTARTDRDGATVRPPRSTLRTAMDSLANSALEAPSRAPLDAHEAFFERIGAGTQEGSLARNNMYSNRAADAAAVLMFIVEYDVVDNTVDVTIDTTGGTDRDGAHVRVPTTFLRTAMDTLRNAGLTIATAPERDSREGYYWTAQSLDVGHALRALLGQAGRGGDAYAVVELEIEYEVEGPHLHRAEEY
jgi:hypothetical protein